MFTLDFDICFVHFRAILTEIIVFKRTQTFLKLPIISWKVEVIEMFLQSQTFYFLFRDVWQWMWTYKADFIKCLLL